MGERFEGMESGIEFTEPLVSGLAFLMASNPSKALIKITVSGTNIKPEKQPLPESCGMAAVSG